MPKTQQPVGGSPKVPEAAREAGFAAIMDAHYSCRQTNAGIAWSLVDRILGAAAPCLFSALLSDEVVEAVSRQRWESTWSSTWDAATASREDLQVRGVAAMRASSRAALQAVIDHIGGPDAH